jgi:uncharacterized protein YndB with AHSA1/START domain
MDTVPTEITMTQEVAATPERVYAVWTDAALLATWWWPQLPDTTYDVDAVVGGDYRIRSEAAGIGVHGRFVALEPPHRLELTWVWEDGADHGPEERVVVDLAATATGTLVTVTHAVADPLGADDFRQGWTDCLARLGKFH